MELYIREEIKCLKNKALNDARKKIAEGQIEDVLIELIVILILDGKFGYNNNNSAISLLSDIFKVYESNHESWILGLLDYNSYLIASNKVIYDTIEIISKLEKEDFVYNTSSRRIFVSPLQFESILRLFNSINPYYAVWLDRRPYTWNWSETLEPILDKEEDYTDAISLFCNYLLQLGFNEIEFPRFSEYENTIFEDKILSRESVIFNSTSFRGVLNYYSLQWLDISTIVADFLKIYVKNDKYEGLNAIEWLLTEMLYSFQYQTDIVSFQNTLDYVKKNGILNNLPFELKIHLDLLFSSFEQIDTYIAFDKYGLEIDAIKGFSKIVENERYKKYSASTKHLNNLLLGINDTNREIKENVDALVNESQGYLNSKKESIYYLNDIDKLSEGVFRKLPGEISNFGYKSLENLYINRKRIIFYDFNKFETEIKKRYSTKIELFNNEFRGNEFRNTQFKYDIWNKSKTNIEDIIKLSDYDNSFLRKMYNEMKKK